MLDLTNPAHAAARERLRAESAIWLTTVTRSGQPQSSPVWFLWNDCEFLIYGSKDGQKTRNIAANPRVGLNLDGDAGGMIVVFEGTARVDPADPNAPEVTDYLAKYRERIESLGWNLEQLLQDYPHAIRVSPSQVRIW